MMEATACSTSYTICAYRKSLPSRHNAALVRPAVKSASLHHVQRAQVAYSSVRTHSHNQRAEFQLGWPGSEQFYESEGEPRFDVLGLAQAMIDCSYQAADDTDFLERNAVEKGSRRIISAEERTSILESLEEESYAVEAGGSLSNTLMCLARLSSAAERLNKGKPLRIGMAGLIGADALGSYYSAHMKSTGVEVVSPPTPGALTGSVVVVTTPDAQRTMLSYLGTPTPIVIDAKLESSIASSSVLLIEGYLWEIEQAQETIMQAIAVAKRSGTLVAMTAGDAGVVDRHHPEIWSAIVEGIDLLFTNAAEAEALVHYMPEDVELKATPSAVTAAAAADMTQQGSSYLTSAERAALALGPYCSLVSVTDGSAGSIITALGQLHVVPPYWTSSPPVDTCGAGDAYAAGLMYGFLRKFDVAGMGRVGSRLASSVIAYHGAALNQDAALLLAEQLPVAAERGAVWSTSSAPAVERA